MKEYLLKEEWRDYPIEARIYRLDDGLHVLVIGGCRTHVGAVSYAFPGESVQTIQFPIHRDGRVSEQWAKTLCAQFHCPVTVNCGIHYDNVSKADIQEIVAVTEQLLQKAMAGLVP